MVPALVNVVVGLLRHHIRKEACLPPLLAVTRIVEIKMDISHQKDRANATLANSRNGDLVVRRACMSDEG